MWSRFAELFFQAIADTRKELLRLFSFDLVFKLALSVIFAPLVAWLFTSFVGSTGKYVLSDFEIAQYLLSPVGVMALLVLGSAIISINMIVLTGMFHIFLGGTKESSPSLAETITVVIHRLPKVSRLAAVVAVVFVFITAPFLFVIAKLALPLVSAFDINYYLAERPPEFWKAVGIAAPAILVYLAILLYLYVSWSFSLLLVLYRDSPPISALKESRQIVGKNLWFVGGAILSWSLVIVILSSLLSTIGVFSADLLLSIPSSLTATLFIVASILIGHTVSIYLVSLLTLSTRCALLVRLYLSVGDEPLASVDRAESESGVFRYLTKVSRPAVGAIAILFLCVAGFIGYRQFQSLNTEVKVLVIAHRGSSATAPENTVAAIKQAVEERADYVEIDVQETKDGEIAVIHDKDLKRVSGDDRKIGKVDFAEVSDVDIGSWFDPKFSGERLPLLTDAIHLCRGKSKLLIELKYSSLEKSLAERVLKILEQEEFLKDSQIMSLEYRGTQETKELNPDIEVGFLSNVSVGDLNAAKVDFLAISGKAASRRFVKNAHQNDKQVYVWTINTAKEMAMFIDRGVDGLITDKPDLARKVIDDLNQMSVPERLLLHLSSQLGLSRAKEYAQ